MGLPSSGKSTVASLLSTQINDQTSHKAFLIDADDLGKFSVLSKSGDFSLDARHERGLKLTNIIKWVQSKEFITIVAAIGQPPSLHEYWRSNISNFNLVYLQSDLSTCQERDFKGTYKKEQVVGLDIPFEPPVSPDLVFDSRIQSALSISNSIFNFLEL